MEEKAIFGFPIVQAKRREKSREEIKVWITCLELWYGILVWKSLFVYVWVRKTLTHNKGVSGFSKSVF